MGTGCSPSLHPPLHIRLHIRLVISEPARHPGRREGVLAMIAFRNANHGNGPYKYHQVFPYRPSPLPSPPLTMVFPRVELRAKSKETT